jgi:hypothetical protein
MIESAMLSLARPSASARVASGNVELDLRDRGGGEGLVVGPGGGGGARRSGEQ